MGNSIERISRNPYLILKAFKSYVLATVLAVMATSLAVIVDGIIVGNIIGKDAFSAVNYCAPIIQLYNVLHLVINQGCCISIANALGKKEVDKANRIFSFMLLADFALGVIVAVAGVAFLDQMTGLLCEHSAIQPLVKEYLRVIFLSAPVFIVFPGLCFIIRIDSAPMLTTVSLLVGNVVNLILDIVFLKYFHFGISATAWATAIGMLVGVLVICTHFLKKERLLQIRRPKYSHDVGRAIAASLPIATVMFLLTVRVFCFNTILMNAIGYVGIVISSVCYNLFLLVLLFNMGVNQTIIPMDSLLNGAGDHKGIVYMYRYALTFLLAVVAAVLAVVFIFPEPFARLFGMGDFADLAQMRHALRLYCPSLIFYAVNFFMVIVFVINHYTKLGLVITFTKDSFVVLGLWIFATWFTDHIWWAFTVGEIVSLAFTLLCAYIAKLNVKDRKVSYPLLITIPENNERNFNFSIPASIDGIKESIDIVSADIASRAKSGKIRYAIDYCVEEVVSSLIHNGYAKTAGHYIDVFVIITDDEVRVTVCDDGKPFNPLTYEPRTKVGNYAVKQMCKEVLYTYAMNQNSTTLIFANGEA